MTISHTPYFAYLLRLWQAGDGDQPQWRASLEIPATGEQVGFTSPEEMFEYLKKQMLASHKIEVSTTNHPMGGG
jgi:hypothetical protein